MTDQNPNPLTPKLDDRLHEQNDQPIPGSEIDEFFQRLPGSLHWPKPNAEAVAAAVEAIQRLSGSVSAPELASPAGDESGNVCSACGGALPASARFCVWCGASNQSVAVDTVPGSRSSGVQHHVHHHYLHFDPGAAFSGHAAGTSSAESPSPTPRGRAPGSPGTSAGGRSEAAARQLVQDWAQACNTRHIDDLLELYVADATLVRSSVPPVRSLPAIREFLVSLLEAGLGDVEMESLRLEVLGDIAFDLGRCKMLVPVSVGKRREERGKYLLVLVKQPAGNWKILADCWASDLPVNALPPTAPSQEPAVRKVIEPIPPARKPR